MEKVKKGDLVLCINDLVMEKTLNADQFYID